MRRRLAFGVLFLVFGSQAVFGYKAFEHHDISNFALDLSLQFLKQEPVPSLFPQPVDPARREAAIAMLEALLPYPGAPTRRHYGDLVVSVDHYLDLDEFLRVKEREFFQEYSKGGKTLWEKVRSLPRFVRAVHGNGQHFQEESLKGFSKYHKEAIRLAAEGDLPSALLFNALADHFLQDFLASGHVITPRASFHDMTSASVHDFYNDYGSVFQIRKAAVSSAETQAPWQRLVEIAKAAQRLPARKTGKKEEPCRRHGLQIAWNDLQLFVDQMEEMEKTSGHAAIVLYGDGSLGKAGDARAFLALIATRSALDVVASYVRGEVVDGVGSDSYCWTPSSAIPLGSSMTSVGFDKGSLHAPSAAIDFGFYDIEAPVGTEAKEDPRKRLKTDTYFVKGLMLSASLLGSDSGLTTGRRRYRLDYIPSASPPRGSIVCRDPGETREADCLKQEPRERVSLLDDSGVILLLGYTYMEEPGMRSHGPYLGALAPLRNDSQVRWWFGYRSYAGPRGSAGKGVYGIGYEKGFGLLFLHADVERDFEMAPDHHLAARWTPSIGVNVMVPLSWLPFF
jgi:hypothetical protein